MKISAFGTGYVGLVTGVCFSEVGNTVTCVDIDESKIKQLQDGISPIYEPGLSDLLKFNLKAKRLKFTTQAEEAIHCSDVIIIAVGTPPNADGSANLSWIFDVAQTIGFHINGFKTIILKSTVPVGTNSRVKKIIQTEIDKRKLSIDFNIISNPEFLREGNAIIDCMKPDRIVVGCENDFAQETILRLYQPFISDKNQIVFMDLYSSELTKYAANALLATKISFMNEISELCEKVGANVTDVKRGLALDHRIGPHFINAGIGYGGSCFPKDVKALIFSANSHKVKTPILSAVEERNDHQRRRYIQLILSKIKPNSKVALWGIAFKPGTDDIREAPSLDIIQALIKNNHTLCAFDPVAAENATKYLGEQNSEYLSKISFENNQYDTLKNAEALIVATEWEFFKEPDYGLIKSEMNSPVVFDCRNIYDLKLMKQLGFKYYSIGRKYIE
jgi:UDPglucose 6-dehydrogenase